MNKLVKLLLFAIQNVIRPFVRIGPVGSYSGIRTYPYIRLSSVPKADDGMANKNKSCQGCGVRGGIGGAA